MKQKILLIMTLFATLTSKAQLSALPECIFKDADAKLTVVVDNYTHEMQAEFEVRYFVPFGTQGGDFETIVEADDNGRADISVSLKYPRKVEVICNGSSTFHVLMAPEDSIVMHIESTNTANKLLSIEGLYGDVSMELNYVMDNPEYQNAFISQGSKYKELSKCNTPEKRLKYIEKVWNQNCKAISKLKCSEAIKTLLTIEADNDFINACTNYGSLWLSLLNHEGIITYRSLPFNEMAKMHMEFDKMLPEETAVKYLKGKCFENEFAPLCNGFWEHTNIYTETSERNRMIIDAHHYLSYLNVLENMQKPKISDSYLASYIEKKEKEHEELLSEVKADTVQHIFKGTLDDVAPEELVNEILKRYPGKTVLFDMWETWCGPCRQGHQEMTPMKSEMKSMDIVFVNISSPSSNLQIWDNMVKTIHGDHFLITKEQCDYLKQLWESNSVPIYAIYGKDHCIKYKTSGFPGVEPIKKEIEKALK